MDRRLVLLESIEQDAISRNIPIMQREGLHYFIHTLLKYECKSCLEIGSAIGYSAMMLCLNIDDFYVETIELNKERYEEAVLNINKQRLEDNIVIHHHDALEFDCDIFTRKFDCLFIDAAKAQYQKFFEKYIPHLNAGGICVVDNLDFHGMIHDIDNIKNRNTKQLVKKIKRFKDWLETQDMYEVKYEHVGDGLCIIQRR